MIEHLAYYVLYRTSATGPLGPQDGWKKFTRRNQADAFADELERGGLTLTMFGQNGNNQLELMRTAGWGV